MPVQEGLFTIPTRLFLSREHRRKLDMLVREQGVDLPELLTELMVNYLDQIPELERAVADVPRPDITAELNHRRAELRRLRARLAMEGPNAAPWLRSYIRDLEGEIERMEGQL